MSHDHDRAAIMHVKCPSCREILLTAYDARHRRAGQVLAEVAAMDEPHSDRREDGDNLPHLDDGVDCMCLCDRCESPDGGCICPDCRDGSHGHGALNANDAGREEGYRKWLSAIEAPVDDIVVISGDAAHVARVLAAEFGPCVHPAVYADGRCVGCDVTLPDDEDAIVVDVPTLGERVAQLPTDPGATHPCTGPDCAGPDLPAAVAGFLAETTAGQARAVRDLTAADQESEATA